jgi:CRP/FNR family transcriptional regulator
MQNTINQLLSTHFSNIYDKELREEIAAVSQLKTFAKNDKLISPDHYLRFIPLVVSGALSVYRIDDDGNELFLYHVHNGNTCAESLVCATQNKKSKLRAVATEPTEVIAIPITSMPKLMMTYQNWHQFVISAYEKRLNDLLETIDMIAFHKMDERLLDFLEKEAEVHGSNQLQITHQEIANAIHTSREVISRLLKQLEKQGEVELGRNKILLKG